MVLTCNQYLWIGFFNSVNIMFHILRKKSGQVVISLCSTAKFQEAFDAVRFSSEKNVFWGVEKKKKN